MEKLAIQQFVVQDFHAAEAMKTLRTNLQFSGESISVVALTSVSASEGKTTVSFQLAASLAQSGKQVLLLDADLRKSVLAERLRIHEKVEGLSQALIGQRSVQELVYETDYPGMSILFAGTRVPNSVELLGSNSFKRIIDELREQFDYVIVDAAPLGQVIDCAVFAPVMDGVLMVIDSTRNSYKLERRVKNQLEKAGGKVLGVVLNRVDFKGRSGYYGKGYGYGYGEE